MSPSASIPGYPVPRPNAAPRAGAWPVRGAIAWACLGAVLIAALFATLDARADVIGVKSAEMRLEEDGYVLNAEFDFSINATLEEALQKGVPLYFNYEFELTRPRRFWFDEKIIASTWQYRVSYSALTQQYRFSSGLLAQTLNSIEEVQRALSRVNARPVARRDQLSAGERYEAGIRLRLDVDQLPKPFQMNALTSREWQLQSEWHRWSFTP